MKALIADDHAMIRVGLKQTLAQAFPGVEIGEAQNAQEALDLVRKKKWDLVIMDISMPGRSGLDVLPDIQLARPGLPVLVISMHSEDQFAVRVLQAGAAGFISKAAPPEELALAVRKILGGGRYVSEAVSQALIHRIGKSGDRPPHELLSDRELQVMCMFAAGKPNKQIAAELCISAKTVSTYRARILEKLNFQSTAEITRYAIKNGLVD